jgi:hypothetical protein
MGVAAVKAKRYFLQSARGRLKARSEVVSASAVGPEGETDQSQ